MPDVVIIVGAVAIGFGCVLGWPIWVTFSSPPSDRSRIKSHYESEARKVTNIGRFGTEYGGRNSPSYRTYQVDLDDALSGTERRLVGVEATWFGYPSLREFNGSRWRPVDS